MVRASKERFIKDILRAARMVPCRSVPVTSEANIQSWTQTDITSRRSLWKNTVRIFSPSQRIYTMEELGRRWHAPRESHPQLFTHIMRYRKRTAGHVLTMTSGDDIHTVHVKSDSDGARKSSSSGIIVWCGTSTSVRQNAARDRDILTRERVLRSLRSMRRSTLRATLDTVFDSRKLSASAIASHGQSDGSECHNS